MFVVRELQSPDQSYDIVYVILRLAVFVQYRLMTDGQTNTRSQHSLYTSDVV